jgi:hypothetical protein
MDLDLSTLRMPDKLGVNYDDHIYKATENDVAGDFRPGKKNSSERPTPVVVPIIEEPKQEPPKKTKSLMDDDDDIFGSKS